MGCTLESFQEGFALGLDRTDRHLSGLIGRPGPGTGHDALMISYMTAGVHTILPVWR